MKVVAIHCFPIAPFRVPFGNRSEYLLRYFDLVQDFLYNLFRGHFLGLGLICHRDAVSQNIHADCPDVFRDDIPPSFDEGIGLGTESDAGRPSQPANAPAATQPATRPANQPAPSERPVVTKPAQPNNRPEPKRPTETPAARPNNRTEPSRNEPAPRAQTPPPSERPQQRTPPPAATAPGTQPKPPKAKPLTPEEKKRQDEQRKRDEKPQPPQ